MHAGALICAWIALSGWAMALATAGLLLSGIAHWRRLRGAQSLCGLDWREDALYLQSPGRPPRKSIFCGGGAPAAFWALLHAREETGGRIDAFFAADAFETGAFRRLRVWLRWQSPQKGAGEK